MIQMESGLRFQAKKDEFRIIVKYFDMHIFLLQNISEKKKKKVLPIEKLLFLFETEIELKKKRIRKRYFFLFDYKVIAFAILEIKYFLE